MHFVEIQGQKDGTSFYNKKIEPSSVLSEIFGNEKYIIHDKFFLTVQDKIIVLK
jgi:hypothetical protein